MLNDQNHFENRKNQTYFKYQQRNLRFYNFTFMPDAQNIFRIDAHV